MSRWSVFLLVYQMLIGVCCTYSVSHDMENVDIHIENLDPKSTVHLDSLLESIHYIPLETNQESLIGTINEILITEENLIILDIYRTSSIFVFDRSGKFINKINRPGRGPGEYTQPADIAVDKASNTILLLNEYPAKIIKYDFSGNFIDEIPLPIRFVSFTTTDNGDIVLFNEPYTRNHGNPAGHPKSIFSTILLLKSNGEFIGLGGDVNQAFEENELSNTNFGLMNNTSITFHPLFNDTIFEYDGHSTAPILTIDFGANTIKENEVEGLSFHQFLKVCAQHNYYYINGQHGQTSDFIAFFVYAPSQEKSYYVLFNKKNQDSMVFYTISSSQFNPCNIVPITAWQEYFVSIVSVDKLLDIKYRLKNFEDIPEKVLTFTPNESIVQEINEYSNPVLAFYKFRPEKINMESVFYE